MFSGRRSRRLFLTCCLNTGDPVGVFNLTAASYLKSLDLCKAMNVPILLLGGGGYAPTSVAKLWYFRNATP